MKVLDVCGLLIRNEFNLFLHFQKKNTMIFPD